MFASLSSGLAPTTGRLLDLWRSGVEYHFRGHDDAMPMRELNQGPVTFRLRTRCSTTELLPPLNSAFNLNLIYWIKLKLIV